MNWFANRGLLAGAAGVGVLAIGLATVLPNLDRHAADLSQPEFQAPETASNQPPVDAGAADVEREPIERGDRAVALRDGVEGQRLAAHRGSSASTGFPSMSIVNLSMRAPFGTGNRNVPSNRLELGL